MGLYKIILISEISNTEKLFIYKFYNKCYNAFTEKSHSSSHIYVFFDIKQNQKKKKLNNTKIFYLVYVI